MGASPESPVWLLVLAARGAAAVLVVATLVGGLPRLVMLGLAVTVGLWTATLAPLPPEVAVWLVLGRELVIGATLGVLAAVPLLAAAIAGRLVDLAASPQPGPYGALFALLAAAVFVGIDGHVAVVAAILDSHRAIPALATVQPRVLAGLAGLVPAAVGLAVPWLVTAAVVQLAIGAGLRVAGRTGAATPAAAAVPAALVMMTAALIASLAIALAARVRGAL